LTETKIKNKMLEMKRFINLFFILSLIRVQFLFSSVSITRDLPDIYNPGTSFQVTINGTLYLSNFVFPNEDKIYFQDITGTKISFTTGSAPVFNSSYNYITFINNGVWFILNRSIIVPIDTDVSAAFPSFSPVYNWIIYVKNGDIYGVHLFFGSHTGANNSDFLQDDNASWTDNALVGLTVYNITDGSSGTIFWNNSYQARMTLEGGSENDWDKGDSYLIVGSPTKITNAGNIVGDVYFSPDGEKIIYTGKDNNKQIFSLTSVISENGINVESLTKLTTEGNNYQPRFSKDGSKIVFVSDRDGSTGIYTMNTDGSNQTKINLTVLPDDNPYPCFSPLRNNFIAFLSNGKIHKVNTETGEVKKIEPEITTADRFDWREYLPTGIIILETLPENWSITTSSPSSSKYIPDTNTYRWLFANNEGISSISITYTVDVPSNASGIVEFTGEVNISSNIFEIDGDQRVGQEKMGDIDGDGEVDISDVILCLRQAVGLDPPQPDLADINEDGEVDISDVILILRIAVGLD